MRRCGDAARQSKHCSGGRAMPVTGPAGGGGRSSGRGPRTPMRILMIPVGTAGDVYPHVGIGLALARRGHDVSVLANAHFEPLLSRVGLPFTPVGTEDDYRRLSAGDAAPPAERFSERARNDSAARVAGIGHPLAEAGPEAARGGRRSHVRPGAGPGGERPAGRVPPVSGAQRHARVVALAAPRDRLVSRLVRRSSARLAAPDQS